MRANAALAGGVADEVFPAISSFAPLSARGTWIALCAQPTSISMPIAAALLSTLTIFAWSGVSSVWYPKTGSRFSGNMPLISAAGRTICAFIVGVI